MIKSLRNAFFAGLVLLAPLGVTIVVVRFLLDNVGAPAGNIFFGFLEQEIRDKAWVETSIQITSLMVVLFLITLLGFCSNYLVGKFFVRGAEQFINRVPFVNTVYNTVKQIVETFSQQKRAIFQRTVLVEYPRKGAYALGFLTGDARGEVQHLTNQNVLNVFIPTTPNPTSGFLLMIPAEEIVDMEMSIADGMKLIISGGAVVPPYSKGMPSGPIPLSNPPG